MSSRGSSFPPYTMSSMIIYAIWYSPRKALTLTEICSALESIFHLYDGNDKVWYDKVRNALRRYDHFIKSDHPSSSRKKQWSVDLSLVPNTSFRKQTTRKETFDNWPNLLHQYLCLPEIELPEVVSPCVTPCYIQPSKNMPSGLSVGTVSTGLSVGTVSTGLSVGTVSAGLGVGTVSAGLSVGTMPAGLSVGTVCAGLSVGTVPTCVPSSSFTPNRAQPPQVESSGLSFGIDRILSKSPRSAKQRSVVDVSAPRDDHNTTCDSFCSVFDSTNEDSDFLSRNSVHEVSISCSSMEKFRGDSDESSSHDIHDFGHSTRILSDASIISLDAPRSPIEPELSLSDIFAGVDELQSILEPDDVMDFIPSDDFGAVSPAESHNLSALESIADFLIPTQCSGDFIEEFGPYLRDL